jgi:hypothetical protein
MIFALLPIQIKGGKDCDNKEVFLNSNMLVYINTKVNLQIIGYNLNNGKYNLKIKFTNKKIYYKINI